jgi:hypothetical protein
MSQSLVDKIVNAVLYEGYVLYPYRPSVKNHQRWTFGGVYPRAYSESQSGNDSCFMQTECLVRGNAQSTLQVQVRFLHLLNRVVRQFDGPVSACEAEQAHGQIVESLQVGDRRYQTWQEAVEREVAAPDRSVGVLCRQPWRTEFRFPGSRRREAIHGPANQIIATLEREQESIIGAIEIRAERLASDLFKVRVRIENLSPLDEARRADRDAALRRSLVSTHTVLGVRQGEFVSLLEPPEAERECAASCQNVGAWPVLVGKAGERDTMLSSPIILYDYPEIAPESPGDLFDATEVDEILSLRILTLTEEEKKAAASVDERVRAMLQRTQTLSDEQFLGLHGTVRGLRPIAGGPS